MAGVYYRAYDWGVLQELGQVVGLSFIDNTATNKIGLAMGFCNYTAKPDIAEETSQNISNTSKLHPIYLFWVPAHMYMFNFASKTN